MTHSALGAISSITSCSTKWFYFSILLLLVFLSFCTLKFRISLLLCPPSLITSLMQTRQQWKIKRSKNYNREGNGTPLQYSCLENPMDGGAWWAAVHGVARVRHNWATSLSLFTLMHWRRKWQPTPVFLPGESQGWGSLVGCRLWGHTESDTTEVT